MDNFLTPCSPFGGAANSAELRSFRRGCMALQSSKDKGSKQVSTTYFCFQALGMAVPCNSREVKLRAFRLRCFFILSFQLCCLAVLCLRRSYPKCLKNKTKCWPLFSTVPPVFSSKICKKSKRNARPFQLGNNLRPIFWYCVVGFLPKYV